MQYIILDDNYDTGHVLMYDIEKKDNIKLIYKDRLEENRINNFIFRIVISQRMKKIRMKKIKNYIYNMIFSDIINIEPVICVVMISAWYDHDLLSWLQNNVRNLRLVLLLRDTVESNILRNPMFDIWRVKEEFDLVFSYDQTYDVKEYGLEYAPVFMSKLSNLMRIQQTQYDICFIALAKDRLSVIHKLYKRMVEADVKPFFFLLGVKKKERLTNTNIVYSAQSMNRISCLENELKSNCILEILKGDAHSNTLRYWEAIIYNRKLLTNWKGIKESHYYNPKYIQYFDDVDNIDMNFIKQKCNVDYHYNNELSPTNLLNLIKQKLDK